MESPPSLLLFPPFPPCDPGLFVCLPVLSLKMAIATPRRSGLVNEQEGSCEVLQGHVMRTAVFL